MTSSAAAPPRAAAYPKILLVGDSITQQASHDDNGWGFQLQKRYIRRADVLNRGLSGWNSRWLRQHIDSILRADRPPVGPTGGEIETSKFLVSTLWIGANDSRLLPADPSVNKHRVPLDEFRENVRFVAARLLEHSRTVIILTPPPVAEKNRLEYQRGQYPEDQALAEAPDRNNEHTGEYVKVCLEVAKDLAATCREGEVRLYGRGSGSWRGSWKGGGQVSVR